MTSRLGVCLGVLVLSGCATGPAVRASRDLPVRNVVLYRSGVGYFERSGKFSGDALKFEVEQHEVGDFLASLTAVERGAGGVRSVSFEVPEQKKPSEKPVPEGEQPEPEPPQRVDVRLELSGPGEHDVSVAYVVGSPIWRPSYRIVFDEKQQALLQAWAVVQNDSGEDWRDVQLTLTTGAPISFRSDLGTPIVPERPMVSDSGEVVMAVPTADVALAQEPAPPPPPAPMPAASMAAEGMSMDMAAEASAAPRQSRSRENAKKKPAAPVRIGGSASAGNLASSLEQQVKSSALISNTAESVTRYDIKNPVTIPNGGSTMVAVISQRVTGERAHLFAPDGGVPGSSAHPFAVARMENGTGAVLERGPVSVLANGAFLGQGLLDTLPREASAFVPFALDKTLVVEPSASYGEETGALVRISHGMVTVQRFSQRKTKYQLRNGGSDASKVYIRHERWGEAELVKPPTGTELSPGRALVPISVAAKGKAELEVLERTPVQMDFTFFDQPAADAVAIYLAGPAVDAVQGPALKKALELRSELTKLVDRINALESQQGELSNGSEETRNNLKAIEKVSSAGDLRARLVTRLKELDTKLSGITKELVEARTHQSELQVRLSEALDGVTLDVKNN